MKDTQMNDLSKLLSIMKRLRGPDGCPWDKEQTLDSIKWYLIEESHEVLQAIESRSPDLLMEELGDTLFQIVFLCEISEEKGDFNIFDVINSAGAKMVRRHPHVFHNQNAQNSKEVKKIWWKIKDEEKGADQSSILDSVPETLPSLLRAYRIGKRASQAGFDWNNIEGVLEKFEEEVGEFKETLGRKTKARMEDEMGDILFSLTNLCRFLEINPEEALKNTTRKFITRFREVEKSLSKEGKRTGDATPEELKALWNKIKDQES